MSSSVDIITQPTMHSPTHDAFLGKLPPNTPAYYHNAVLLASPQKISFTNQLDSA